MIRVLFADDHVLVRAGLKKILEEAADICVIAEADNGAEAVDQFKHVNPDVVIMDISMPGTDGMEAIGQLLSCYPHARILVLTMYPEEYFAVRTIKAGCLGYITKGTSPRELHQAVRTVARGETYLSEDGRSTVALQLLASKRGDSPVEMLSDRELQVLCFLARGLKSKEIATELNLSPKTIDSYRTRVLQKLNLRNNADMARFAFHHRLIQE